MNLRWQCGRCGSIRISSDWLCHRCRRMLRDRAAYWDVRYERLATDAEMSLLREREGT